MAGEKTYIIKAGLSHNENEPQVKAVKLFKEIVEKETNGKVKVEIYPNNQLGNLRDVVEGLQLGTVQMTNPSSVMCNFVPELNVFELPFLFRDREHFYSVLDSEIGESLKPKFEAKGFHLLGYFDCGIRHIMTVDKTVNSIEDLKGLKIRTMENPAHLDAFQAFGANPMPMAYGELYTALEQKVIDGAEAANTNYYAKKFFEPAPNWAQVGWITLIEYCVMSRNFYESLPDQYQVVIDKAAREMVTKEREWYRANDENKLAEIEKEGVHVTYPDRKPFMEASKSVYEKWAPKVGGMELIEKIVNF
jgi:tripartite ATP-independent transporter DctP family solute receptor